MEEEEELVLVTDIPTHLEEEEEVVQNHRQDFPQEVLALQVRNQSFLMEDLVLPVLTQDSHSVPHSVHHHHLDLPRSVLQEVDSPGCCWELRELQLEGVYHSNQMIHMMDVVEECFYYKDFSRHPLSMWWY